MLLLARSSRTSCRLFPRTECIRGHVVLSLISKSGLSECWWNILLIKFYVSIIKTLCMPLDRILDHFLETRAYGQSRTIKPNKQKKVMKKRRRWHGQLMNWSRNTLKLDLIILVKSPSTTWQIDSVPRNSPIKQFQDLKYNISTHGLTMHHRHTMKRCKDTKKQSRMHKIAKVPHLSLSFVATVKHQRLQP